MPRKLLLLLWLWFAVAIGAAIALALLQPEGPVKWALRAVAFVPACLLANAVVEQTASLFMSLPGLKQGTRYFERRAEGKDYSAARAAWYAFCAVLGFVVFTTVAAAMWSGFSSARDFIAQDKCLDGGGKWSAEGHECQFSNGGAQ
ncbi:hypothetical protein [Caenimonas sp. SL110]|uniref:hypothetical protein n=1 Tax=Caenimonas sp. SL110 TaxID=1450524 RepID=UPI00065452AB|nr:hypothetical protein [Caenimonas sp. SL110]